MLKYEFAQTISMFCLYGVAITIAWLLCRFSALQPSGDRYASLDGLRGLAAVGVVACHLTQYVMSFAGFHGKPALGNHVGIFSVQMFFALTAFLFTNKAISKGLLVQEFLLGRIRRILPLYFLTVFIALAVGLIYTSEKESSWTQTTVETFRTLSYGFWPYEELFFRGLNMLSLIGIAWSLSYEWAFYLLLIPAFLIWKRSAAIMLTVLFFVTVAAIVHFSIEGEGPVWPFFLPGVLGALIKSLEPSPSVWFTRGLTAAGLTCLTLAIILPGEWSLMKFCLANGVFFAVLFGPARILRYRQLRLLGMISYSIYLLQYIVLFPVNRLINDYPAFFSTPALKIIAVSLVMVILLPLACVSFLAIEKRFFGRDHGLAN